tara:strand:+ start:4589 stop:5602 length:1014 start_codon:yes stop_codon:yes gene_type:complete
MAFLDNSGDILLDAVLTDLGRKRLAEGVFNVTQFALGDEEINYGLYNTSDTRGSLFYDLEIMQTPILEAFTSNESLMKTRLLTFSRTDLLYMPILKINDKVEEVKPSSSNNGFLLLADRDTVKANPTATARAEAGFIPGMFRAEDNARFSTKCINVDQGIDSTEDGRTVLHEMDRSLYETAYLIKVDNRLLKLQLPRGLKNYNSFSPILSEQYLDDDYVATYYIVTGLPGSPIVEPRNGAFRSRNLINDNATENTTEIEENEMFQGPLGRVLQFVPRVTDEVQFSNSFFTKLGSTGSNLTYRGQTISSYKFIDTSISVQGMTTGYSIDIPIRIIKKS